MDTDTTDVQMLGNVFWRRILMAAADGRPADAAAEVNRLVEHQAIRFPTTAAIALGMGLDWPRKPETCPRWCRRPTCSPRTPRGMRSRQLELEIARVRGVAASLAGNHEQAVDHFVTALWAARNLGESLWIARVLADYAQALVRAGRADEAEPLAAEAREAFERMGAVRALARLDAGMPANVPLSRAAAGR